jgi:XTP/dITP diphosphohydrolase
MTTKTAPLLLCLATQNRHKVAELQALLATLAPELLTRVTLTSLGELGISEEVVEDGSTFADNAIIKAKAACERTGLWALSDDSGLQVEALGGAPGIHSARWAGEPRSDERNLAKLLAELSQVPADAAPGPLHLCALSVRAAGGAGAAAGDRAGRGLSRLAARYRGGERRLWLRPAVCARPG